MDSLSWAKLAEHVIDKYGFPIAVLIWMFWRDYMFITRLSDKVQQLVNYAEIFIRKEGFTRDAD